LKFDFQVVGKGLIILFPLGWLVSNLIIHCTKGCLSAN